MIVTSALECRNIIPTIIDNNFDRLKPFFETADEFLKNELLGKTLFDKVEAFEEDEDDELLNHVKRVEVFKGYLEAIPFLDLVDSGTGFAVVASGTNLTPASQARVQALVAGTEKRLGELIENLLEYLEGNADYYNDWKEAKAYLINHESYIFTLREFRQYAPYNGNRMQWAAEMPKLTRAIRFFIEPYISPELSKQIISQLQSNTLSDNNKKIIDDLRYAQAMYITGDMAAAQAAMFKARKVILANVDDYTAFKESDIYAEISASTSNFSVEQNIANFGA